MKRIEMADLLDSTIERDLLTCHGSYSYIGYK